MSQNTLGIIEKRMAVFHYILKAHTDPTSSAFGSDIGNIYDEQSYQINNAYRNFFLGCSISTMVARYSSLAELLKALTGALKDFENLKKRATDPTAAKRVAQASKRLFRRTSYNSVERATSDKKPFDGFATITTDIELNYMTVCHLPYSPDPFQTFISLCESFMQCYRILEGFFVREIQTNGSIGKNHDLYELLHKFDSRVNKVITGPIIKDIDKIYRSPQMPNNRGAN